MNFTNSETALHYLEDKFERAMIPFVLLKNTAKNAVQNMNFDQDDPVEVGVVRKDYTESGRSILKMLLPEAEFGEDDIKLEHEGAPVHIKIINRNYKVFSNPDTVFYGVTEFRVPNPFKDYWKMRHLVR